jgi:hypothetical protein
VIVYEHNGNALLEYKELNVTVEVEKAPERTCVLGVSQQMGSFRITNILNYEIAVL